MAMKKHNSLRLRAFDLWRHQRGRCFYCESQFLSPYDLTLDHILPKSKGGSDHPGNLVACCSSCNDLLADSSARMKFMWMRYQLRSGVSRPVSV